VRSSIHEAWAGRPFDVFQGPERPTKPPPTSSHVTSLGPVVRCAFHRHVPRLQGNVSMSGCATCLLPTKLGTSLAPSLANGFPSSVNIRKRLSFARDVPHGKEVNRCEHEGGSVPAWVRWTRMAMASSARFRAIRSFHGARNRSRRCVSSATMEKTDPHSLVQPGGQRKEVSVVMKFGGSSVADAERMMEVADIVCSFPDHRPCVVLSAMGKTTNMLLQAGEDALVLAESRENDGKLTHEKVRDVEDLDSVKEIVRLHRHTCNELGVDRKVSREVDLLMEELVQLLTGIMLMDELTPRTRDKLVSFGERMSTRIFAGYLNRVGVRAKQFDAWKLGFVTTDDFTNADILPETYANVATALQPQEDEEPYLPIVTGFLGRGKESRAVTTLGRGGSDLTATVIGAALGLEEVQVWKDVDGILTSDPRLVVGAYPVPFLTYDEATELAYFGATVLHPQSMRPAQRSGVNVRVKNSYNRGAPGTVIVRNRDMKESLLTSIVLKKDVTMFDIVSSRMLGQVGFLSRVFAICERLGVSVDVVATSEVSVSLTLDPAKLWSRDLIPLELDALVNEFRNVARVNVHRDRCIISLIGNVDRTSEILQRAFTVFVKEGINVQMMSQGASKTNIALLVNSAEGPVCVRALHDEFFKCPPAHGAGNGA